MPNEPKPTSEETQVDSVLDLQNQEDSDDVEAHSSGGGSCISVLSVTSA